MEDRLARVLSSRIDALASAAGRSAADARAIDRLLETASVAALRAVALAVLTDAEGRDTRPGAAPAHATLRDAA
jgi:hypothetical protein